MAKSDLSHRLDVFETELHLARSGKEWRRLRRREHTGLAESVDDVSGLVESAVWEADAGWRAHHVFIYIDVKGLPAGAPLVGVVAHEATHAAQRILEHWNEPANPDSEVQAMLVGWLTTWVYDRCASAS